MELSIFVQPRLNEAVRGVSLVMQTDPIHMLIPMVCVAQASISEL